MLLQESDDICSTVVRSADEIWRLRSFQALRYQDSGLIDSALDALSTPDPLIERSTYFGAYNSAEDPLGTCRLISAPNDELPVFNDFSLFPDARAMLMDNDCHVSEVSRVAVAADAPHFEVLAALVREMLRLTVETGQHTICVAAIEPSLMRIISQVFDMPCTVLGEMREDYYATDNYPVMIDTIRYLSQRNHRNRRIRQWFTDDLLIDLTDAVRDPLPIGLPNAS